jgi:hypothetical protein
VDIRFFHGLFSFLNICSRSYPALHLLDRLTLLDQGLMALGESLFSFFPLTTIFALLFLSFLLLLLLLKVIRLCEDAQTRRTATLEHHNGR